MEMINYNIFKAVNVYTWYALSSKCFFRTHQRVFHICYSIYHQHVYCIIFVIYNVSC